MSIEVYFKEPWHDENLKRTKWGLRQSRLLLIVGLLLGSLLTISLYGLLQGVIQ